MLLREEEQALRRALYVSLRDTKSDPESPTSNSTYDVYENHGMEECEEAEQSTPKKQKMLEACTDSLVSDKRTKGKKQIRSSKTKLESSPISLDKALIRDNKGKLSANMVKKISNQVNDHHHESMHSITLNRGRIGVNHKSSKMGDPLSQQNAETEKAGKIMQAQRKFAHSQPCSPNRYIYIYSKYLSLYVGKH